MEKVRIRNIFRLFVPLNRSAGSVQTKTEPFGVEFVQNENRFDFNIKLVCTDEYGNIKNEPTHCFSWAKRNPVIFEQNGNGVSDGIFIRLKIRQGVFDFRKTKNRLFRIIVDLIEDGSVTKTGLSMIQELFPKKRQADNDNEAVLPVYWLNEEGYIIDNQPDSASNPFIVTPESGSNREFYYEDSVQESYEGIAMHDSDPENQIHSIAQHPNVVSDMELHNSPENDTTSNNENYMVLFNGNAEVVGNFRALNFYKASDINIKEDIRLLEEDRDCRASLLKINGVEYKFKQGVSHSTNKRFIGYIAQQIESVVPEAVQLIDGILHVDYESLIPYLSESVKQNYGDIQHVTSEVEQLKILLNGLHEQFAGVSKKHEQARPQSSRTTIIGLIVSVAILIALAIGIVIFTSAPLKTPPVEHLSPANYEREMLLEIYRSLYPESYTIGKTDPHCNWLGVTCNSSTGRVTEIKMSGVATEGSGLGTIPASIGNFTELQHLDLSYNYLNSTIPESIKKLENLIELNLGVNALVGTVPDLRGLKKLRVVKFNANSLNGPLDTLIQLPAIEILVLNQNPINVELPNEISPSLQQLSLAECSLYGTIPSSWTERNLTLLELQSNFLNGSVPCFGPDLVSFYGFTNMFTGEFCGSSLKSLQDLVIHENMLTGMFDMPNVEVSHMSILRISNNRFTSFMPSATVVIAAPTKCIGQSNQFKCPVPDWAVQHCDITCEY